MTTATRKIAFIDSRVADYQTLIDGLAEGTEWFQAYEQKLKDEATEKRKLRAEVWKAYKARHIVHLGGAHSLRLGRRRRSRTRRAHRREPPS